MSHSSLYVRKTKPTFVNALIPAVALILVGIVVLTNIFFVGLLLLMLGIFALTITEGLEIDFNNQKIRIFFGMFGLRFGKWDTLPKMTRMTLVPVKAQNKMTSRTNLTIEATHSYFQVRLYPQATTEYYIASIGNFTLCQADAKVLSKHFGLPCENYIA